MLQGHFTVSQGVVDVLIYGMQSVLEENSVKISCIMIYDNCGCQTGLLFTSCLHCQTVGMRWLGEELVRCTWMWTVSIGSCCQRPLRIKKVMLYTTHYSSSIADITAQYVQLNIFASLFACDKFLFFKVQHVGGLYRIHDLSFSLFCLLLKIH